MQDNRNQHIFGKYDARQKMGEKWLADSYCRYLFILNA